MHGLTQPRTQLSMATCPGQRTMEATRGNGYAPAWGSLLMMMMMMTYNRSFRRHLSQAITCLALTNKRKYTKTQNKPLNK